jgi:hypothetical protein
MRFRLLVPAPTAALKLILMLAMPATRVIAAEPLDAEDRILVAAYQHQVKELSGVLTTFCLARGSMPIMELTGTRPVGTGAPARVVAALAARGYDVVSAGDCSVGANGAEVEVGSKRQAVVLYLDAVDMGRSGIVTVEASYWYDSLGCRAAKLRFSLDGRYLGSESDFVC